jgi:Cu/Ag efflux pump CusA
LQTLVVRIKYGCSGSNDENIVESFLSFRQQALGVCHACCAKGQPLGQVLLHSGIVRVGQAMITVGATILTLDPLAIHGGPPWQPLCFAQPGGLGVATFITLVLVLVVYSIFVPDLKIVEWGAVKAQHGER